MLDGHRKAEVAAGWLHEFPCIQLIFAKSDLMDASGQKGTA